ncbi:MAG: hypothetical protein AAF231_03665 [Pseudomonadota bacterium]
MIAFKTFLKDENGVVSVDWIVLTACIVSLAALVGHTALSGVEGLGSHLVTDMEGTGV